MTERNGITFEQVASAAQDILDNGGKLTVRAVMKITGGKTETVSGLLRDFNDKRDADVVSMADELGSSKIAHLLAGEMQSVVERKTADLKVVMERLKKDRDEVIELLDEKERDCVHRVELAEARALNAEKQIAEANQKMKSAIEELDKVKQEASSEVKRVQQEAQSAIKSAEQKADSLVSAANHRLEKAEAETASLREQIKSLSIDNAKFAMEREKFEQENKHNQELRASLGESNTLNIKLESQKESLAASVERLTNDLGEYKSQASELPKVQTLLIESERKLADVQNKVYQLEREKDSLSRALAVKESKNS
ncbi:DNA-binding protein [Paraglaciecola chathamensis]|uniref:KfrA N-terminal DNA-binding domain-containing protein n=1 Tax=Paraglaciecola chathamensis TaxID=368405 RepID=A0A8H9IDZ8_9ALTE|nr:DNA-binding protein [Paraglaciecola oceanifecundans]GGZ83266.1 hypothetical protein GCM10011274_46130 [Paraglaciecola oceanifecundans]